MQLSHRSVAPCQAQTFCSLCRLHVVYQEDPIPGWDICSFCQHSLSSDTPNTRVVGKPSRWPAFSVEFEIQAAWSSYDEARRALILLKHGFIRTKDSSVDDEYKSPIYQSLAPFREVLPVLNTLSDLVNDSCGTHLHVSCPVKRCLRPIHQQVFAPLVTYLEEREQETIAFWGRTFNEFASQLLESCWACFNIYTSYDTLEFRLPRFKNATQYMRVLRFSRAVMSLLTQHLSSAVEPDPMWLGHNVLSAYQYCVRRSNA